MCRSAGSSREFDGLSGSVKQKAIRTVAAGVTHLSGLDGRDDVIAALHDAMLATRQAHPAAAARPGRRATTTVGCSTAAYGVRRFWFKTATLTVDGVPWIIEVAVADTVKPGRTWFACNHAPAFGDPLGRTYAARGRYLHHRRGVIPRGRGRGHRAAAANRAAVVHVICAATQFVDKGKVALVVPTPVAAQAAASAGRGHQDTAAGSRAAAQGRPQSRTGRAACPR